MPDYVIIRRVLWKLHKNDRPKNAWRYQRNKEIGTAFQKEREWMEAFDLADESNCKNAPLCFTKKVERRRVVANIRFLKKQQMHVNKILG